MLKLNALLKLAGVRFLEEELDIGQAAPPGLHHGPPDTAAALLCALEGGGWTCEVVKVSPAWRACALPVFTLCLHGCAGLHPRGTLRPADSEQ